MTEVPETKTPEVVVQTPEPEVVVVKQRGKYAMEKRAERLNELVRRLKEAPKEKHSEVIARFAFDFGLREEKIAEYYRTLKRAGILD